MDFDVCYRIDSPDRILVSNSSSLLTVFTILSVINYYNQQAMIQTTWSVSIFYHTDPTKSEHMEFLHDNVEVLLESKVTKDILNSASIMIYRLRKD